MASRPFKLLLRNVYDKSILPYSSRVLLQKLTVPQLLKKFPALYGSLPFSHMPATCPYPEPDRSSICLTSSRSILILCSHLHLGLTSDPLPLDSPTKTLYMPPHSPICPAHLILHHFITWTMLSEQYRSLSSSLCSFLHSPVTLTLLGPNILLSTLLSNTLSLCSSLNVSDQVSHPYKTTRKITVLYILIFNFCIANWKTKYSAPNES